MLIRAEQPAEHRGVEMIHQAAFGGHAEADVVTALRQSALFRPDWSLVAYDCGSLIAHGIFSHVGLQDPAGIVRKIVVLGPLAVLPPSQRQGAGSALVRYGLELLDSQYEPLVIVRGELGYYGGFGFRASVMADVRAPFPVAEDLALALRAYRAELRGTVRYPRAFGAVGYQAQWF
jgi:putative acetyltransferase